VRTKLDEIVEEIRQETHYHAWPECRAAMRAAAERAFRYGVEQVRTASPPRQEHTCVIGGYCRTCDPDRRTGKDRRAP
jgi:hypothetical protein